MEKSIVLARVIGIYMAITSIALLTHSAYIQEVSLGIVNNPPLLFVSSLIALIVGSLIITCHNLWQANWKVIITIIGWIAFIKGVTGVVAPQLINLYVINLMQYNIAMLISGIICLLIGLFLLIRGKIGQVTH